MELLWRIELENGSVFSGSTLLQNGENHIVCEVPDSVLKSVTAMTLRHAEPDERVFVNGFQSWTYSPEYAPDGYTHGFATPLARLKPLGLERYGDYYFTEYPETPGITHGESYAYWRRGERFSLLASLDETNGYTLIRNDTNTGKVTLSRDCCGVRCSGAFHAFDLFCAEGTENEVFDAWFAAMGLPKKPVERIAGYSSWYNRYQKIDEKCILSDLEGCAGLLPRGDVFQIDDGWEPAVGDWLTADAKKFPKGMRGTADRIHEKGYRAGLWLAPFVCQKNSEIFRRHKSWLLRADGKPWYCGSNWGGFYALDIDNPQVTEYLRDVFRRVFTDWGFDLVKLDFLYAAAPVNLPGESRAKRMTRAVSLLRELCGDHAVIGCGVPLMPAFGRVDYCRIGCDVGLEWDGSFIMKLAHRERISTKQSLENTLFRRGLNGRAFGNDPDVFFLRTENLKLSGGQKMMLAQADALLGSVFFTSDDVGAYTDEQRECYRTLRRLLDAENVRVCMDGVPRIEYTLGGEPQQLALPFLNGDGKTASQR